MRWRGGSVPFECCQANFIAEHAEDVAAAEDRAVAEDIAGAENLKENIEHSAISAFSAVKYWLCILSTLDRGAIGEGRIVL